MTTLKVMSVVLVGAVVTAACGDAKSSMLPTAPSAVGAAAQNSEADGFDGVSGPTAKGGVPGPPADKGGNGKKPDETPGKAPTNTSPGSPTAPGIKKVEIEGLISAKSGDSITVNGQQVVVPSTCPIRHGQTMFTFGDLRVGDRVHVRASKTTSESSRVLAVTTLEATEVILQNPGDGTGSGDDTPSDLVSVTATDAFASEIAGNTGTFTLTRSGSATLLAAPLTVTYTVGGTGLSGADYTALSGTVTFAPTVATATVVVTPVADATTEGAETVKLTLTTVAPYDLGSPAEATVTITDTNFPLVTVTAFDSTAAETGNNRGTFRFSRVGSTAASLTVTFTVTGTATNGTDYQTLPVTVTFGVGQADVDLVVVPTQDGVAEGSETVIVTVTDDATYDVGAPDTATVTISG
jgi:Calx-beta domain/Domain of unknown function (DUF5666)